jgi:hypothetical protein
MLRSAALLSLMLLAVPVDPVRAQSADAETITAVNTASDALHEAFVVGNADGIRSLMTADHVAVTPYYDGLKTVDEQIASAADLTGFNQTVVGEASVVLLAPTVALRTFVATWEGSYKGAALPKRVFVNETLVNRNGEWLERFYQVTAMKP